MEIKSNYISPEISVITIDHEISLALESDPFAGPGEELVSNQKSSYHENPCFKDQIS